jgi:hypothetical protein
VYLRLRRSDEAQQVAVELDAAAKAKGQAWSLARAMRCRGLLADDTQLASYLD